MDWRDGILLGGAAILALMPAARRRVAAWLVGGEASRLAYAGDATRDTRMGGPMEQSVSPILRPPIIADTAQNWTVGGATVNSPIESWAEGSAAQSLVRASQTQYNPPITYLPKASPAILNGQSGDSILSPPATGKMPEDRWQTPPIIVWEESKW